MSANERPPGSPPPVSLSSSERAAVMRMLDAGVPVLTAPPSTTPGGGEYRRTRWRDAKVRYDVLDRWRPGWMLAALTGIAFDVIDIDPRNGGDGTWASLS